MRTNVRQVRRTHEGAPAFSSLRAEDQLRRTLLSCLLFERQFYEDGQDVADRIMDLCDQVPVELIAKLAIEARQDMRLRHAPLLLLCALVKRGRHRQDDLVRDTIAAVIQRADEPGEFISLYWRNGRKMLPAQVKRGLAAALCKFDAYQFAKYDRQSASVKLRDVFRLVHPKPKTKEQSALFHAVVNDELSPPDTWESQLTRGADKAETFTRLLTEKRLGYMALLRNLRNMHSAGVDEDLVRRAILERKGAHNVLPFRYVAAARACPTFEPELDTAMQAVVDDMPRLPGRTVLLIDVSISMNQRLSERSDLTRLDAACALAAVVGAEHKIVFSFSEQLAEVPPRNGMAMIDAIRHSQRQSGTYLGAAVRFLNERFADSTDRLIVVTDEQSHDPVPEPEFKSAYMINVASYKNGVGYGKWTHIDGFSEKVVRFIHELEGWFVG